MARHKTDYSAVVRKHFSQNEPQLVLKSKQVYPRTPFKIQCTNCRSLFTRNDYFTLLKKKNPCPICNPKKPRTPISSKEFIEKIKARWPDQKFKLLSVYMGKSEPIKIRCAAGHTFEVARAEYLIDKRRKSLCSQCLVPSKNILEPYSFKPITRKKVLSGRWVTLFEPYNCYQIRYLKHGKWEMRSSKGILNPHIDKFGYHKYDIYWRDQNGERYHKGTTLHRIIYSIMNNKPEHFFYNGKLEIDHRDRKVTNNRPSNLRLASDSVQMRNRKQTKIRTFKDVVLVFKLRAQIWTYNDIAKKLNCDKTLISLILKRKIHIKLIEKMDKLYPRLAKDAEDAAQKIKFNGWKEGSARRR